MTLEHATYAIDDLHPKVDLDPARGGTPGYTVSCRRNNVVSNKYETRRLLSERNGGSHRTLVNDSNSLCSLSNVLKSPATPWFGR